MRGIPMTMVDALAAPELIDLEVASVWRRQVMAGGSKLEEPTEPLDAVLVTGDKLLSRSPGRRCQVQVIG